MQAKPDDGERYFRFERLTFRSQGQKLIGAVWMPAETTWPPPGILLLHGFPGVAPIMNDLVSSLCQSGFETMIFHYRGCWGSAGRYGFLGALTDARKALDVFIRRKEVDSERIAVVGHSFGGLTAIHIAAKSNKVKAVAALCPVSSLAKHLMGPHRRAILRRGLPFVSGFTMKGALSEWEALSERYDPVGYVDQISPRPFLLIHGDRDDIIPINCSTELFARAQEPKEMTVVNGADHIFAGKRRSVTEKTVEWLGSVFPERQT
jgi:dipeptidyl aminopeptidase/acylaminoacyl peptidase